MNLLILSDLHIGEKARCATLKATPGPKDDNVRILEHLKKLAASIARPIDRIILPGDLTNAARISEYRKFDNVVDQICTIFSISPDKIYATLGNHDCDWHVQESMPEGEERDDYFAKRYDNVKSSTRFMNALSRAKGDLFDDHYCLWNDDICVVTINTGFCERPEDQIRHGLVTQSIVDTIRGKHEALLREKYKLKLMLVHHHPFAYRNVLQHWRDHSAIQNSQVLIDFFEEFSFDLIVHGHRHVPDFHSNLTHRGRQLIALCCGSFSVALDANLNNVVSNQIHLVELGQRDTKTGVITGCVKSWAFTVDKGWIPSEGRDGIEHIVAFGPQYHEAPLRKKIDAAIVTAVNKDEFVRVSDIVSSIKELKHQRETLFMQLFADVCRERGLDLTSMKSSDGVILKKKKKVTT